MITQLCLLFQLDNVKLKRVILNIAAYTTKWILPDKVDCTIVVYVCKEGMIRENVQRESARFDSMSMTHLAEEIPLLTHQHRADTIWRQSAKDQPKLKCQRSDSGIWDTALDHIVLRCLLRAGFYGVYRIGPIRLDHHLITTLVERWRIEMRTFHFPVGESTVTLQNMAILFGLPIDGHAVTGKDPGNKLDDLIALCIAGPLVLLQVWAGIGS
ncbi:unnamed protein product [Camellia sinensis]